MSFSWIQLKHYFIPGENIKDELAKINQRRMLIAAPILFLLHLLHIALFFSNLQNTSGIEYTWKKAIILSHIVGGTFAGVVTLISLIQYQKKIEKSLWLQYIVYAVYLLLNASICAIDQYVTSSITPYLVACTGMATFFLLPPWVSSFFYFTGYFAFHFLVSITQNNPELLLTVHANGITASLLGLIVSLILYTNQRTRIKQDLVIQAQKKALERKNAKLIALNQAKSEFLDIAAHDLKNPLGVIQGISSLLLEYNSLPRSFHEKVYTIMKSTQRMVRLISDLLNVNKIEEERITLHLETVELNFIAEEVIKNAKTLSDRKQQELILNLSTKKILLKADENFLQEILENLVSNAIKYSEFNKNIYINTFEDAGKVYFQVYDEGPGMEPKEIEMIFQKFIRLSHKPTAGENSTGLGLFIVKKLTNLMNGQIDCKSKPGVGSTFTLSFPAIQTELSLPEHSRIKPEEMKVFLSSQKILFVDDDLSNRNLMKVLIGKIGGKPILSASGEEALIACQTSSYDLIFLDMQMPGMDGIATKAAIKNLGNNPIFILCTGGSAESDLSRELGFDYCLEKPFDKSKLFWVFEKIYRSKALNQK